ncbi:FAD-dependent oxidoreductase [Lysinibacter cavernae]|uniref:Glycine/D-amino acid oxidase-like deaminating enzyme n=1 Tax=Lysinibacter cavernae TaxID=1640652 RepID=A0A7X5R3D4_9MICO|nr:glycine/D-amino acid oxidase-like deaminating enzyme [Lysinibacter cavernae]
MVSQQSADVVVIGAGIIGAACARTLSMAGHSVILLERGASAGGTSSHGEGNLLLSDKGPGDELRLSQYAADLWQDVIAQLADELGPEFPSAEYEEKGGLVVATTAAGAQPLLDFAESQRGAGVEAQPMTFAEAKELEPQINPAITAAVFYPGDAQIQPVIATEALLASARVHGATVRQGVRVTAGIHDASGRLVGVKTTKGDVHAGNVIVAAGPWSGEVAALLGSNLPVKPRRGMVLVTTRMPHQIFRKVYDGDYVGAVGSGDAALQTSSVVESTAAGTVLIGSSRQQIGFDDRLRVEVLRELSRKALRIFPFLEQASVMRSYGGFRPFMPDHLPVIGEDYRMPGLWYATGHEGAGIGLCVATANILSDSMSGLTPRLDPAPFTVGRASLADHLTPLTGGSANTTTGAAQS